MEESFCLKASILSLYRSISRLIQTTARRFCSANRSLSEPPDSQTLKIIQTTAMMPIRPRIFQRLKSQPSKKSSCLRDVEWVASLSRQCLFVKSIQFNINMDFQQLVSLMQQMLLPDTQAVKQATISLKRLSKDQAVMAKLLVIVDQHSDINLRLLGTIILKKSMISFFEDLSSQDQSHVKAVLLRRFKEQSSSNVKNGLAILMGKIVAVKGISKWPQLELYFGDLLQSANKRQTLLLMKRILSTVKPNQLMLRFIESCCKIRELAKQALECIASLVQSQQFKDKQIASRLIACAQQGGWGEAEVFELLDIMDNLIYNPDHIDMGHIRFILQIVQNSRVSQKLRCVGVDVICKHFGISSQSYKGEHLQALVMTLCKVLINLEPLQLDSQQETFREIILNFVQQLSINLKAKLFFPLVFKYVTQLFKVQRPAQLVAGFDLLSAISEGCRQKLILKLQNPIICTLLPKGLQSDNASVKASAVRAISHFAQFLMPNMAKYHRMVIPILLEFAAGTDKKLMEISLTSLDCLVQKINGKQSQQISKLVMPVLGKILQDQGSSQNVKTSVLDVISSCMQGSARFFLNYLGQIFQLVNNFLGLPEKPQYELIKASSISLLAQVGYVYARQPDLKNQVFNKIILPKIEPVMRMLQLQSSSQVKQACLDFLSQSAQAMGSQFSPYLQRIINATFKSATLKQVEEQNDDEKGFQNSEDSQEIVVNLQELDEKTSAIHALGEFAKACPQSFAPYSKQTLELLEQLQSHFNLDLKLQVIRTFENLVIFTIKYYHHGVVPEHRPGLPCLQRLHPEAEAFIFQKYLHKMCYLIEKKQDSELTGSIIVSLTRLLQTVGPCFLDKYLQAFSRYIYEWLKPSQQNQTDILIFQALLGLIPQMAKNYLQGFVPCFSNIYKVMFLYFDSERQVKDNQQIIGCFAQCFQKCPTLIDIAHQQLIPLIVKTLSNGSEVLRNSAYCLGIMVQKRPHLMQNYLQQILTVLKNIWQQADYPEAKDNALASICRCIIAYMPPIPYQKFVQNLLISLPLKGDFLETKTCLRGIMYLSGHKEQVIIPVKAKIGTIFGEVLKDAKHYNLSQEDIILFSEFERKCV